MEAEDLESREIVSCAYGDFPDHFGFFLPLAGITTVKQIRESAFDIRATSRLNRLYIELLKDNPEWGAAERRSDMNHFMARLIFCFFAEDTDIFRSKGLFTDTVAKMSERDSSNTHEVIAEIFRAMNIKHEERAAAGVPRWAAVFPYEWKRINPDIFGSMIQAVADDEERGALGMHYTSVPNILKVLNPLFLDDLRTQLEEAGDNARKLLNLRKRISRIRVFDPACGSGNFLVIAYKQMREIEDEMNTRRGERGRKSDIPLTNFRGIELRDFAAEIARLALIIAEYQCDILYRGQQEALAEFLPLDSQNWITCGNALRLDWLSICPPTGTSARIVGDDLFVVTINPPEVDFENEGGETYICGNPPYKGSKWQTSSQKADLANAWEKHAQLAKTTDYVSGWIAKYLDYVADVPESAAAFVMTNSICQGQQASEIWPVVYGEGVDIAFARLPFKWSNLAGHNAGVTVIVVGLSATSSASTKLYDGDLVRSCSAIGPYLVPERREVVQKANEACCDKSPMVFGNMPRDGEHLFLDASEAADLRSHAGTRTFVRRVVGSEELINGLLRYCLWIEDSEVRRAMLSPFIANRLAKVAESRRKSPAKSTQDYAQKPHRFVQIGGHARTHTIAVPGVSSEGRNYLPCGLLPMEAVISNKNFALYDAPLWNMALIASRLHWVWIGTVCVRMRSDFSYSNTLV